MPLAVDPLRGVHLRRGCFSVKMFAKTKELGPVEEGGIFVCRSATGKGNFVYETLFFLQTFANQGGAESATPKIDEK